MSFVMVGHHFLGVILKHSEKIYRPICYFLASEFSNFLVILGKTVKQYHEEKGERVQLINLGNFDKEKHVRWLKQNPSKLPKTAEFRKHVSHFYSDGDFCELSGNPIE